MNAGNDRTMHLLTHHAPENKTDAELFSTSFKFCPLFLPTAWTIGAKSRRGIVFNRLLLRQKDFDQMIPFLMCCDSPIRSSASQSFRNLRTDVMRWSVRFSEPADDCFALSSWELRRRSQQQATQESSDVDEYDECAGNDKDGRRERCGKKGTSVKLLDFRVISHA